MGKGRALCRWARDFSLKAKVCFIVIIDRSAARPKGLALYSSVQHGRIAKSPDTPRVKKEKSGYVYPLFRHVTRRFNIRKGGRFVKISLTKALPALSFFLAKFQQNRVFCKVVFTFCALFSAKSRFCAGRQTTRKEKSTMFVVLCAGISPLAKIYSLCACQASLPIFERQMRTQRIRARRYAPGEIPRTGITLALQASHREGRG